MVHLTFTGYYAGTPICGIQRNETDKYVHAIYAPTAWINGANPEVCPDCLQVWRESEDDEE